MPELNTSILHWQGILHTSLRQIENSSGALEYLEAAAARHQLLHNEAANAASLRTEGILQLIQKNAQLVNGGLNQFLSTPIRSDNEEIRKILMEAFLKFSESLCEMPGFRMISTESKVLAESTLAIGKTKADALLRGILANGKQQLAAVGFKNGKWRGDLYASTIAARTCEMGISIEEMILRSVTAEAKEGKTNVLPDPLCVWNVQMLRCAPVAGDVKGLWEIGLALPALAFGSNQSPEWIVEVLETMEREYNLHGISLSRGLLPATTSEHYIVGVRIMPDGQLLREIVRWFFSQDGMKSKENATIFQAREIFFEKAS
jgi:hypothetical protein